MMIRSSFLLAALALVAISAAHAGEQEIFLPDDCDALTINGKGFQLRFEEIKKQWEKVSDESAKVEVPRPETSDDASAAAADNNNNKNNADGQQDEIVSNEDLFDKAKQETGEKDYGNVDDDLLEWIGARATSLMSKVERYDKETKSARDASKVVIDIMLLNILVDLDNLNKEEIAKFKWVKSKLRKLLKEFIHEEALASEVMEYTMNLIRSNQAIENKVRNSNDPGKIWITNAQALRRILHEQRYSAALSKIIIEYMAGPFNMMKRSVVYQNNKRAKTLDDGMYYVFARNRVPATFPFAAQDAISHGDH